jgi:hypothetical protein
MTQVHDFNGGIGANGLFWIVQVPDDAVTITDNTLTISLKSVAVVDQLTFPNPGGVNLGNSGAPASVSFTITYQKSGVARQVRPTSVDALSPFNWAGQMWMATNSGTFSLAYNDGSFSAQGSFASAGNFGEMGTERNGSFLRSDERDDGASAAGGALSAEPLTAIAPTTANLPKFKGKIPTAYFVH